MGDSLRHETVKRGLEVFPLDGAEQDVDRVVQLFPRLWLGRVHALLHLAAAALEVGRPVPGHFLEHLLEIAVLAGAAALLGHQVNELRVRLLAHAQQRDYLQSLQVLLR